MPSEALFNSSILEELEPDEIIEIFDKTTETLSKEPAFVEIEDSISQAIFVGDLHGDFDTAKKIVRRFFVGEQNSILIFLGDYIDREPEPEGAIKTLLYLCILKNQFPERVFILKGNHEAHYSVYCYPYEFDRALVEIFGKYGELIHDAALRLFKEMPLMIRTTNGVVGSHAGFPLMGQSVNDKSRKDLIVDILWADPSVSPSFRGSDIPKFTMEQLVEFLNSLKASCLIRGHDPYVAGKVIFSKRCITLSSSKAYAYRAGITVAKVNLSRPVKDADDVTILSSTSFDASE